jgi:hypothetical protein
MSFHVCDMCPCLLVKTRLSIPSVFVRLHSCEYVYAFIHVIWLLHMHMYVCVRVCIYIYIYTYIYISYHVMMRAARLSVLSVCA